jgi:hypothetical protein
MTQWNQMGINPFYPEWSAEEKFRHYGYDPDEEAQAAADDFENHPENYPPPE